MFGRGAAQQAAEKAVKAVVQRLGGEAWGHSVADLLQALAERHDVSEDLLDGALELDKSYIPTRYPDAHPSGSPGERYTRSEASNLAHVPDQKRNDRYRMYRTACASRPARRESN